MVARGGMGVVYRARQLELDREVAVKILSPQLLVKERMVRQFHREALAIARIDHVNIVPIYDYGTLPGNNGAYLVMRLVPGKQLSQIIYEEGALPLDRALRLMEQMCDGISVAHANQIIHCDLKPDNILLEKTGQQRELVQLVDFGIAKLRELSSGGSIHSAITESAIGTPQYMSPEQCCGEKLTLHTDIYSLAVIFFEMITGRVPFNSANMADIAKSHVRTPPPPPSRYRPGLPPELDKVVMRALGKRPGDRPQSASEFFKELSASSGIILKTLENFSAKPEAEPPRPDATTNNVESRQTKMGLTKTNRFISPIKKEQEPPRSLELFPDLSALMVDDSPPIIDLLSSILQEFGCAVTTTTDGQSGLDKMLEHRFDLIICNIVLPDGYGWKMLEKAQEYEPPIPVVFLTTRNNEADRLKALDEGAEDCWNKPFAIPELQVRLKRLLQRLSLERARRNEDVEQEAEAAGVDTYETHFSMGVSYFEFGLIDDAIEELRQALKSLGNPPPGQLHFRCCFELGRCYQLLENRDEARQWYYRSLAIPGYSADEYQKVQNALSDVS